MQTIQLNGYTAVAREPLLRLGTRDSYGTEQLQILPGEDWQGLVITATFVTPDSATRMVVPGDGVLNVPPEATACALTAAAPGRIVFTGVAEGVRRITANLGYQVSDHAPAESDAPAPTPTEWEQYVTQLKEVVNEAVPPAGQPGQVLTKTEDGNTWTYPAGGGGGGGYTIGAGLRLDPESNILSVDTADAVEQDNTRPVTSAAVFTTVGNIDALLATI